MRKTWALPGKGEQNNGQPLFSVKRYRGEGCPINMSQKRLEYDQIQPGVVFGQEETSEWPIVSISSD